MKFNYHTHTCFCDGSSNPEEYVLAAIDKGFSHLGFSGHAPVSFANTFAIKDEELGPYCRMARELQAKYAPLIHIYLGLEFDYIPTVSKDFSHYTQLYRLDYTIGAVHLVKIQGNDFLWFIDGAKIEEYDKGLQELFDGNIRQAVTAFYHQTNEMILSQEFDVVGHFDKIKMNNKNRYFSESESWYQHLIMETLDVIRQSGRICEINTRGLYKNRHPDYYPSHGLWRQMKQMSIPVTISSDAHHPSELDLFTNEALVLLKQAGYKEIWYFESTWRSLELV